MTISRQAQVTRSAAVFSRRDTAFRSRHSPAPAAWSTARVRHLFSQSFHKPGTTPSAPAATSKHGTPQAEAHLLVWPAGVRRGPVRPPAAHYSCRVRPASDDELGRLALTFNAMCASIRGAREELIRQERIATIGRLSTSLVHDLRNPLAAIYGGAEMLVDSNLSETHVKRLARNIYSSARRIQGLLEDLTNVTRGRAAGAEPCRLAEVVHAACDPYAETARAQSVRFEVDVPPEIELPLERSRIERVFVNLVNNALEAMPRGGQLRIAARAENGAVRIEVTDSGPGVPAEIAPRLFQPFVSAGKKNGLGLGLALSRQTVLDHGGDLWLDSRPGESARFCVRLPLGAASAARG